MNQDLSNTKLCHCHTLHHEMLSMQNETDKYYVQHLHSAGNMQERLALQETCKPRQICKNLQRFVFSVSFGIDVQHLHSAGNMQERLARKFHLLHTRK